MKHLRQTYFVRPMIAVIALAIALTGTVQAAWQSEVVDSNGGANSLTVINGQPAISYIISDNDGISVGLNYARYDGSTWQTETVDGGSGFESFGDSSLALVDGQPAISYWYATTSDLRYARYNGSTWDIETIDTTGDVGTYTSLAVVNGQPAISYHGNNALKYARYNGSTWDIEFVDNNAGAGRGTSLAVVDGQPAISYRDDANSDLKYARYNGSTWDIETIDSTGAVGGGNSLAVVNGQPAISYVDISNFNLKYARYNGSTWDIETVDSNPYVTLETSLAVVNNQPAISYYDGVNGDLKYARYDGSTWQIETADSTGDVGGVSSLAVVDGNPAISYNDNTTGSLKYAVLPPESTPPTTGTVTANDITEQGGTNTTISVEYTDNSGLLDETTFGTSDITVTGPGDVSLTVSNAVAAALDANADVPSPVTVNYTVEAPGGTWDFADVGTYTVALVAGEIADPNANTNAAVAELATFAVAFSLDTPVLTAPTGTFDAVNEITLTWDAVDGADRYQVDVYDPYVQIFSQELQSQAVCNEESCSQAVTVNSIVGEYQVYIQARAGQSITSNWALSTFTMELGAVNVSAPSGQVPAGETVDLVFPAVNGASYYVVDLYRPGSFERLVFESVNICTGGTCTAPLGTNGEQGDYSVWVIAGVGPFFGEWSNASFQVGLPSVSLTSGNPAFGATATLTFAPPQGADYTVVDVYAPDGGYQRALVDTVDCTDVCSVEVATNFQLGEFQVWTITGVGSETFGSWTFNSFTVSFDDVTLTSPTGNVPLADTLDLVFNMPAGAYYVVLDVYYPNGGFFTEVVELPDCVEGVCTLTLNSFGLSGEYGVWAIPGWGGQFGNWAFSSFTVDPADVGALAAADVDMLGSAVEALPQLDTSQVEAAVEGPGN